MITVKKNSLDFQRQNIRPKKNCEYASGGEFAGYVSGTVQDFVPVKQVL